MQTELDKFWLVRLAPGAGIHVSVCAVACLALGADLGGSTITSNESFEE